MHTRDTVTRIGAHAACQEPKANAFIENATRTQNSQSRRLKTNFNIKIKFKFKIKTKTK